MTRLAILHAAILSLTQHQALARHGLPVAHLNGLPAERLARLLREYRRSSVRRFQDTRQILVA